MRNMDFSYLFYTKSNDWLIQCINSVLEVIAEAS